MSAARTWQRRRALLLVCGALLVAALLLPACRSGQGPAWFNAGAPTVAPWPTPPEAPPTPTAVALRALDPLKPQPNAAERGNVLHDILHHFLTPPPTAADSPQALTGHNCLCFMIGERLHNRWHFWRDGQLFHF